MLARHFPNFPLAGAYRRRLSGPKVKNPYPLLTYFRTQFSPCYPTKVPLCFRTPTTTGFHQNLRLQGLEAEVPSARRVSPNWICTWRLGGCGSRGKAAHHRYRGSFQPSARSRSFTLGSLFRKSQRKRDEKAF